MGYTELLINSAEKGNCPGCGPTMESLDNGPLQQLFSAKEWQELEAWEICCTCCGWLVSYIKGSYSFASMPPDASRENSYRCALEHPEHRGSWPNPQREEMVEKDFDRLEHLQLLSELDPNHYFRDESNQCVLCGKYAPHKIAEERANYQGHPYTNYLCCKHFEQVFGPLSHRYPKIKQPPTWEISN